MYIIGIDSGASTTKAVVIDGHRKILGSHLVKSGADLASAAEIVYNESLRQAGLKPDQVKLTTATGFGRANVADLKVGIYKDRGPLTITEISCHAAGAYHYFPKPITVIDIGGQDNKVIKVNEVGKVLGFKMNRKCAAGTGAFLEEIAYKMDIPLKKLNQLAHNATKDLQLGSYCTVFSGTEILTKIREGEKKEDIIRGAFCSVVKRIIEMDPLEGEVVLTGGVIAHNNIIAQILGSLLKKSIRVPPEPQLIGALGAALIGLSDYK